MGSRFLRGKAPACFAPFSLFARWKRVGFLMGAAFSSVSPAIGQAIDAAPGLDLRQVRPFTPTRPEPLKPFKIGTAPPGLPVPIKYVDPDTLVVGPNEDTRLSAANPQMIFCHEPAALNSRPLFFEDVPLERLGLREIPCGQPIVSAAKFYFAFPLMVPRCADRAAERFMGTTEPQYFGPTWEPSPFSLELSAEPSRQSAPPTPLPAIGNEAPLTPGGHRQASRAPKQYVDFAVVQVSGNGAITGIDEVLPGFINDHNAEAGPKLPPYPAAAETIVNPYAVEEKAPATQRVVVQRWAKPTVVAQSEVTPLPEVQPQTVVVAQPQQQIVTVTQPQTQPQYVAMAQPTQSYVTSTSQYAQPVQQYAQPVQQIVQPQQYIVPQQQQVAVPTPVYNYVLVPNGNGGYSAIAQDVSQQQQPQQQIVMPVSVPTAQPVYAQAPIAQNVASAAQPASRPAEATTSVRNAGAPEEAEAGGRFPLLSHLIMGNSGEPVPAPPARPSTSLAPPPMIGEQAAEAYGQNAPVLGGECFDPQFCGGWCGSCRPYIGIEATFFAPIFSSNNPITATAFDATANYSFQSTAPSYLNGAPRITVGLGSCGGRGLRFRYWQFQTSNYDTDSLDLANPNDFTGFTSFGQFKALTVDLEATREFLCCRRTLLAGLGVRYVGLRQDESLYAQVLTQPVPDVLTAQATSSSQFYGTGITTSLQCIEPLCNNCWGELDFFIGGRGSAIFGSTSSSVASSAQVGGAGIYAISTNLASADQSTTLMIGELQTGLQWNKCCNPCMAITRVFARAAFEYQYWGLNNVDTNANSFAGRVNADRISIVTDQRDFSSLNFVGFTLSAGCYW
jgi:hypothetical protein